MNSPMDDGLIRDRVLQAPDQYDELPDPIKSIVSRREYLWLSDRQKAEILQELCDPDPENP